VPDPSAAAAGAADRGPRPASVLLALEASTLRPSVALVGPQGERCGHWTQAEPARGTASLAPAVGELLAAAGLALPQLAGIVVGLGPGSYTGTRAAIALARGLVAVTGLPLAGVPSVAGAASAALAARTELALVVTLIDARRGECYRADYGRRADGGLLCLRAPQLVHGADADPDPDALAAAARQPQHSVLVLREPHSDAYDVGAVGRERLAAGGDDPSSVLPLYLKRSHAEIVFDERAGPAGLGGDRSLRPQA